VGANPIQTEAVAVSFSSLACSRKPRGKLGNSRGHRRKGTLRFATGRRRNTFRIRRRIQGAHIARKQCGLCSVSRTWSES